MCQGSVRSTHGHSVLDRDLRPGICWQGGLNLEDSVVRFGLYGRDSSRLWVTTATEALYTWEWSAACDEISEG